MKNLLQPYEGSEPYVFVSYSHKDSDRVSPILQRLQDEGIRIWYDKGIEWGSKWDNYIAKHVRNCECVMAFISNNFTNSPHCEDEISHAKTCGKNFLPIYLEPVQLEEGMEMRLGRYQAAHFFKYPAAETENFYSQLFKSKFLASCYAEKDDYNESDIVVTIDDLKNQSNNWAKKNIELLNTVRYIPAELIVPVVFIVDTSGSMNGKPIEILSKSIKKMIENLSTFANNSKWESDIAYVKFYATCNIAIITFDSDARIVMNYTDAEKISNLPALKTGGLTGLGAALKLAKDMIDDPTVTLETGQYPVVILITDGYPTDDYLEILHDFATKGNSAHCKTYAVGIGESVDKKILKQFALNPILTKTELELEQSFQIIASKIASEVILW